MTAVPWTVSTLTSELRETLREEFGRIQVTGEISDFTRHSSGHWYFSLVEGKDILNCVMFRSRASRVRWTTRVGEQVIVGGTLDVYGPQGRYNVLSDSLQPSGEGARRRALEALKRRLDAEGLTDPARKRPLPFLPSRVAVVTSRVGAALQDVLEVLRQRLPSVDIVVAPCRVQGEGSAAEIAAALDLVNEHGRADVIIVGRGGGSAEDLWAFNEEVVVRAVARSRIPVVSAVGHETDTTLVDWVSDQRAATPSHAAELVVPEHAGLVQSLVDIEDRLTLGIQQLLRICRFRIAEIRLRHPGDRAREARIFLEATTARLMAGAARVFSSTRQRLQTLRLPPMTGRLGHAELQLRGLEQRLIPTGDRIVAARRLALGTSVARLEALSPLAVLTRGYAIVSQNGTAVLDAERLVVDLELGIRFQRGSARARVLEVTPDASDGE